MKLSFVDDNGDVTCALQTMFREFPEIEVLHGDIFTFARNCVVSPANSQGFMDGGFDMRITKFFGLEIQTKVHDAIARRPEGFVPVGSAIAVRTGHKMIPFLLIVPTMEIPEAVVALNAYRAMSAILRIASASAEIGRAIFCSGLCIGVGGVPPLEVAGAMARAHREWKAKNPQPAGLQIYEQQRNHSNQQVPAPDSKA
jgi:O-acetyl-ADP-ribose deacetylase (regulator of RNase III)